MHIMCLFFIFCTFLFLEIISKITPAAAEVPKTEVPKEEVPKEGDRDPIVTNEEHKVINKDDFDFRK